MSKKYKMAAHEIKPLVTGYGACIATDKITVDGEAVDYMYREETDKDVDSGWRFQAGTEDQDYMDDANNLAIYDVNTIANYDPAIIPYLDLPIGTYLERRRGTRIFQIIPE